MKNKEQKVWKSIKLEIKKTAFVFKDVSKEHPFATTLFVLATLASLRTRRGLEGMLILESFVVPCYCISAPILFCSIIGKILPKKDATIATQQKKPAVFLYNSLWFLNATILTATFLILFFSVVLFLFALLNFYPAGMLSCLLIIGVCALIIWGSNLTYRYFEKKLNKTQGLKHGRK
ncbi:MAG: hypothetical protein J6Y85_01460 [Alphaproteobacteria bacterium]|nr:hypothetical protein [Alphaproteobacteria bacterium]